MKLTSRATVKIMWRVVLRWYVRLFLWFRLLAHVARLDLRLDAAHPDRAGGLGFVGNSAYAFAPILLAQGALLAGVIANRIFHDGRTLLSFKVDIVGTADAQIRRRGREREPEPDRHGSA